MTRIAIVLSAVVIAVVAVGALFLVYEDLTAPPIVIADPVAQGPITVAIAGAGFVWWQSREKGPPPDEPLTGEPPEPPVDVPPDAPPPGPGTPPGAGAPPASPGSSDTA